MVLGVEGGMRGRWSGLGRIRRERRNEREKKKNTK